MDLVERLLRAMRERDGVEPSARCYASAITACEMCSQWDAALDALVTELAALVQAAHERGNLDLRQCFEHFDTNFSGAIDAAELEQGLARLGFSPSPSQREALLRHFGSVEPGGRTAIKYRGFLRMLSPRLSARHAQPVSAEPPLGPRCERARAI